MNIQTGRLHASWEETAPVVEFVPCLIISRRRFPWNAGSGERRQYLIRIWGAFADAVRTGKRVRLTEKGFAFEHSLLAFSEESRPLVQMVMEERRGGLGIMRTFRRGTAAAVPSYNTLLLSRSACDHFCNCGGQGNQRRGPAEGAQGRPNFTGNKPAIRVRGSEDWPEKGLDQGSRTDDGFSGRKSLYVADETHLYCDDEH